MRPGCRAIRFSRLSGGATVGTKVYFKQINAKKKMFFVSKEKFTPVGNLE